MKYKKLIFLLCFVFGVLFFSPTVSHANLVNYCPSMSPCTLVEECSLTMTCAKIGTTPVTTTNSQIVSTTNGVANYGIANPSACADLANDPLNSVNYQQNVTGTGPNQQNPDSAGYGKPLTTTYNSATYATSEAAAKLASCLGGTVVTVNNMSPGSPFYIPPNLNITLPNGSTANAGALLQALGAFGSVNSWMNAYVDPYMINAPADKSTIGTSGTATGSNSGSSAGTQGGAKLNVTSSSGSSSSLSSAEKTVNAIKTQVNQEQANYIDKINQVITSVCGTSPDCQNLNNIQTQLYQTGASYLKPIFSTNATGTMHVGDVWNITVTGLNPGETIYATGGKIIGGVVPADKTPYTANGLGIFFQTGDHAKEVIGNWQIVWTRANGTVLGTMTFSVADKGVVATTGTKTLSLTATSQNYCVYSKGEYANDTAIYIVQGLTRDVANLKIVWSSTKNGVSTGESNSYYSQNLNANSNWTGSASAPWSVSDIGSWTKTASAFDGTNIVAVSQPFPFIVKDCSTSVPVGTKTSNFTYTFVKAGNAWRITLDNVALDAPSDFSYIPANASITATSATDLDTQAQNRYNTMSYFPGTPVGNTFYQNIFGTFIAAFYDWNNQVAKASNCGVTGTCQ